MEKRGDRAEIVCCTGNNIAPGKEFLQDELCNSTIIPDLYDYIAYLC